jgi:hypothetical protein
MIFTGWPLSIGVGGSLEAFNLFECMEFGEMHPDCTRKMLNFMRKGEALCRPVKRFIDRLIVTLLATLCIPTP